MTCISAVLISLMQGMPNPRLEYIIFLRMEQWKKKEVIWHLLANGDYGPLQMREITGAFSIL